MSGLARSTMSSRGRVGTLRFVTTAPIASSRPIDGPLPSGAKRTGLPNADYALRNASWHVADIFAEMYEDQDRRDGFLDPLSMLREGPEARLEPESPEASAAQLKHVAHTIGADLVGITGYDERWIYTERFSADTGEAKPNDLPEGLHNVIMIGQAMDGGLIQTAPSALSGTATGLGYSKDAAVLLTIAPVHPQPRVRSCANDERHRTRHSNGYPGPGLASTDDTDCSSLPNSAPSCDSERSSQTCRWPMTSPSRSGSKSSARAATAARKLAQRRLSLTGSRWLSLSIARVSKAFASGRWMVRLVLATGRKSTPIAQSACESALGRATTHKSGTGGGGA